MSDFDAAQIPFTETRHPRRTRSPRIMVVNDEDSFLELIEDCILRLFNDVTIHKFRDSHEAWQELLRNHPDILITDDIMDERDELNGEELVRRLMRRNVKYPIIVTSGWPPTEQWVRERMSRNSNISFLKVPFTVEALNEALSKHLGAGDKLRFPVDAPPISETQVPTDVGSSKARPTPEDFANKLLSICLDADMNGHFYNLLRLTEPQRKRYIFSTFLFTATLPCTMAASSGKKNLLPFLAAAYGQVLNVWKDKDAFVRLGDWVITDGEYIRLPEILETMFRQRVSIKGIENHKIQFGTLLPAVGFIRYDQQIEDATEIANSYPPAQQLENVFMKCGTQLQSYICEDMFCRERSREELLSRATIFSSLAGAYCKRISEVYHSWRLEETL